MLDRIVLEGLRSELEAKLCTLAKTGRFVLVNIAVDGAGLNDT